jgi:hypothetical protein
MRSRLALAVGLGAALAMATLPAGGAIASDHTVALGISIWDGRDLTRLDDFRAAIGGHRVASWTIWSPWGDPQRSAFPMGAANGARDRGAVPVIWWEPYDPDDPNDVSHSRLKHIVSGRHDAYIRAYARDAKQYGGRIILRFAMQANSDYLPWAWDFSSTDSNTIDIFKSAWRRVHGIFRDVGAKNVKFLWTVATQTCAGDGLKVAYTVTNCMDRPMGYPGDSYVDYVGFTWENWAEAPAGSDVPSGPWIGMLEGFRPVVRALGRITDKPVMAAAIASAPQGGDKPAWIRDGYQDVYASLRKVKAIMYLNLDLSGPPHFDRDWSLKGASRAAYADIAALPRFQGRIP